MTNIQPVAAGDRFRVGDTFIRVTRVGFTKPWVDIRCYRWSASWGRRIYGGMPADVQRVDWTAADVEATEPGYVVTRTVVGDVL